MKGSDSPTLERSVIRSSQLVDCYHWLHIA